MRNSWIVLLLSATAAMAGAAHAPANAHDCTCKFQGGDVAQGETVCIPTAKGKSLARCEMVLMSGLPGSGKDHWIAHNLDLPVISLDALRDELDLPSTGNQGAVIQAAREQAREHLRRAQSFVWNATSLTRDLRGRSIDLAASYNARVRIVFLDTAHKRLMRQNRERERQVPAHAIEKMTRLWDPPDLSEAHRLDWVIQD